MSLIKSFNKNFLKENIKKSKGIVIFSIIIIPLLTAIMLTLIGRENSSVFVFPWQEFSLINILCMFILPFVFSNLLFGYIYKKSSVDFMNSMPVNRKTVFVTNTIGGIILITIIQLLTALIVWGCNVFINNVVILPQALIDTIILMWMAYVFIFTATNLAMTISGTYMTQIVITVLILFLVPFCVDCFSSIGDYNRDIYTITAGNRAIHANLIGVYNNYTLPYKLIRFNSTTLFSVGTIMRMLILSIIYFFLGLILFNKRKMENCEESFSSLKGHLILKTITLIPILLVETLLGLIFDPSNVILFVLPFLVVYYFVYDFIVKRKVPFKISVLAFITSIIVIPIGISGISVVIEEVHKDEFDISQIKSVSFGSDSTNYSYHLYYDEYSSTKGLLDSEYFFKDSELIKWVFDASYNNDKTKDDEYSIYYNENYAYLKNYEYLPVNFKTKSGKVYSVRLEISSSDYDDLLDMLLSDEKYNKNIAKNILKSNGAIISNNKMLDSKDSKYVNKILNEELKPKDLKKYNKYTQGTTIMKYVYRNHHLEVYYIPLDVSNELIEYIAEQEREYLNEYLDYVKIGSVSFDCIIDDRSDYVYNNNKILNFIEENLDEEFDSSKPYAVLVGRLQFRDETHYIAFYTNQVDKVRKYTNRYYD